ncbi:Dyp-type peroxidase family [Penicillium ucsense]|uniref:Dyp-type peroxidase family n=1 Tax=Penicillium ucsense TaxID=2839758 RepID=A0A8J8W5M9_9EURO|nr:Dyp-type peroxidase family [Penicillium ucsense]KAF7735655.1 Dyp-type peroxidase family [Penicillium ucsense]
MIFKFGAPLTRSAIFLVLPLTDPASPSIVRSTLPNFSSLSKSVFFRDSSADFASTIGIGSSVWTSLNGLPSPKELHTFLIVMIYASKFERQLMKSLGSAVKLVDETVGFRYFDSRDLGFIDGTANPESVDGQASTLIAAEDDPNAAGGSYILVQKYLHDLTAWQALSAEKQEQIIGRTKFDNIELGDAEDDQQCSHKNLNTVEDANGEERDILRDNMTFGSLGSGEFGTYFIGYTGRLWVKEKMVERIFVGHPPGLHDRILDYSKPVTGAVFFAPSVDVLQGLAD